MRKKLEKFFAFFVTALMVFEMMPALAWAEVGEAIADGASGISQQAEEEARNGEVSGDAVSDDSYGEPTTGEPSDPGESEPTQDDALAGGGEPSADPAASDPAAISSDEPTAIANLSETDKADPTKSGLITYKDDGINVTFRNHPESSSSGFEYAEGVTHQDEDGEERAVWKSSASQTRYDTSHSTMVFDVSKPCYVVFDYLLASKKYGDSKANNSSLAFAYTSKAGATDSVSSFIPNAEQRDVDAAGLADPSNWKSAVLYLNATDGFGAWFEHTLADSQHDENELHSAYISNLRFYESFEQVPASCKVHLSVETIGRASTPQFSSFFPTDAKNGDVWLPKAGLQGGSSYDIPLNSELFKNGTPDENESLEKGYSIIGPDGSTVYKWAPGDGTCSYRMTEPGNYTLKGVYEPFIQIPTGFTLSVDTDGDGTYEDVRLSDDDLATIWKSSPDGKFSCEQDFSTDSSGWAWKISYGTSNSGTKLAAYDESGIELDPQTEGTPTIFVIKPGRSRRNIKLVFSAEGHASRTLTLCFTWSEKLFSESFPTVSATGITVGVHNDFDKKVKSYQLNTLSDANTQYRAFLFDPEKADAAHEIVYATSQSNRSETTYSFNFTWSKAVEGLLSFDYLVVPYDEDTESVESSAKYTFSVTAGTGTKAKTVVSVSQENKQIAWSHAEIPISSSIDYGNKYQATVEMTFETPTYGAYAAISNVAFDSEKRDITVNIEGNGTVSNDGEDVATGQKFTKYGGGHLNLVAKAASDSTFAGWYENGKLVSGNPTFDYVVSDTATLTAKFVTPSASDVALVMSSKGTSEPYATLDAALDEAAEAGEGTFVTLLKDASLAKSATVPKGATLLVPCKDGDGGYDPVTGFNPEPTSTADPTTTYRTLTIPKDVTLTVEGTLLVNAVSGNPSKGSMINTDADGVNAAVKMYGHGKVSLEGSIDVKAGGTLDSFGYVEGAGGIRAESGSTVGDLFIVRHWRGGTVASNMYFANIFPFSEYSCRNIKASVTIESGASYEGLVRMYALSTSYNTRFPLIDNVNGLIRLADGAKAVKTYDATNESKSDPNTGKIGVETIAITGGASFESSRLDIAGMNLTTAEFIYPWDGSHAFQLSNGTYTFENDMKFMPGAKISATGAKIVVSSGTKVAFYDETFEDKPPVGSDGKTILTPTAYTTGSGTAATLTLDAASSLQNDGNFSGTVKTSSKDIIAGSTGAWSVASKESDGASKRTLNLAWESGDAKLSRPGFTWKFGSNSRDIVWTGANFAGLEAAIARVPADEAPYTQESWKAVQDALAKAEALKGADLGADRQAEVDSAARALEDAIAALAKKTFTITFSAGDDAELSGEGSHTVEYGGALASSAFPSATRPGYDFKGWEEGGALVTELKDVIAAHALSAKWEAHEYTITYEDVNGDEWGSANHPSNYTIEDANITLGKPTRVGYAFAGWTISGAEGNGAQPADGVIPTGTYGKLTAKASWTALTFDVTFNAGGGTLYANSESADPLAADYKITVTYDLPYPELPVAKKDGYKFSNWEIPAGDGGSSTPVYAGNKVKITSNTELKAVYSLGDFSIEYDLNGGSWNDDGAWKDAHKTYTVETETFELATPVREGYTFLGWSTGGGEPNLHAKVTQGSTGNLNFRAEWKINVFDVTFDPAQGLLSGSTGKHVEQVEWNKALGKELVPTRTGYTFAGWLLNGEGEPIDAATVASTPVTSDVSYTASWQIITYDIHYAGEGTDWQWPSGSSVEQHPTSYTVEGAFTLATPVKEGHAFSYWTASGLQELGSGADLSKGVVAVGTTGELTFTPHFSVNSHKVTWQSQGGTFYKEDTLDFGASIATPEAPTRAGYRFDGWKLSDGSDLPKTMPDRDLTAVGQWTSYLDELKKITSFEGDDLITARKLYALLNPSQVNVYKSSDLYAQLQKAVQGELERTIRQDVHDAIGDVNAALAPNGSTIATLSETNQTTGTGTPILDVVLEAPDTLCYTLVSNPFLRELFNCEDVENVTVGQQVCEKDTTMNLMMAVAWEALHDDEGFAEDNDANRQAFQNWLLGVKDTLKISVLSGHQVPASLNGAMTIGLNDDGTAVATEGADKVSTSVPYVVRFYEKGKDPTFEDLRSITFDLQGGTGTVAPIEKRPGLIVSEPSVKPTKVGYDFVGWYTEANGGGVKYVFTVMPEESITLFAKWDPYPYTVNFDADATGASGSMDAKGLVYDQQYELPSCGFERTGYSFAGWQMPDGSVRQAGEKVSRLTAVKDGSVTLKATWTANRYKVTFDAGAGTLPEGFVNPVMVAYDSPYGSAFASGKLPEPTREGYSFVGWFDEANPSSSQVNDDTIVAITGEQTLTAHWTVNGTIEYRVRYWKENLEPEADGTYGYTEVVGDGYANTSDIFEPVEANQKSYPGFTLNEAKSTVKQHIKEDGSTVFDLYYDRETYTVTWRVEGQADIQETYRFEEPISYGAGVEGHPTSWDTDAWHADLDGWQVAGADGTYTDVSFPTTAQKSVTFEAKLKKSYEAETPDHLTTWRTLAIAMENVTPGTADEPAIVSLHGKANEAETAMEPVTLEGDLTVPSGVMLLLPYKDGDTGYDAKDNGNQNIPGPPVNPDNPTPATGAILGKGPYSELVLPSGSTLKVEGRVLVNALVGRDGDGHFDHDVTGGWGRVTLKAGSKVLVEDGGTFDSHGYVEGAGSVTAKSGGTVGDLFVVRNWRGGSQASAMYSLGVYPYNEYDCHNIAVPVTIEAGGSLEGLVTMHALEAYYSTRFPLVDPENGLIRQTTGSVTRTYLPSSGREVWDIEGGAEISQSTLFIIQLNLSTAQFTYPIDGDMDFVLREGAYTFTEDFKFMPGSTIQGKSAQIRIRSGASLILYEEMEDPANTAQTEYPKGRGPATLTLDASSSLQNDGTFAGHITTQGTNVQGSEAAQWEVTTLEANGYYAQHVANETRALSHALSMTSAGNTWRHSRTGRILWNGEQDSPIEGAIDGGLSGSTGSMTGTPDVPYTIETSEPDQDGSVTWTVDVSERGLEESASSLGYDVMEAFLSAAHENQKVIASVSTMTGEEPELTYSTKDELKSWPRLFAQKLGLVRATAPEVEAEEMAAGPTVGDLVGRHCQLLITSVMEEGMREPAKITYDLIFTCSERDALYAGLIPVYRLYNPYDGQHLLTTDEHEYEELAKIGWQQEGITSYQEEVELSEAAITLDKLEELDQGSGHVFRLYNPHNGDHLYTMVPAEVSELTRLGWEFEDAVFQSADPKDKHAAPVYRLFNKYMTENGGVGAHLYTPNATEYAELGKLGWNQEDACWYAAALPPEE